MNWFTKAITSTIGRKLIMSLTGLFLISFLFVHLIGNFQLFLNDGGLAFNQYTKFMTTSPLIKIAEIILVGGFALHIATGIILNSKNSGARKKKYAYKKASPGVNWFSTIMFPSGMIVLTFLVIHIYNFWFQHKFGHPGYDEAGNKDMYQVVEATFQQTWGFSVFYIIAMILLAFHLNHGFQSAFQTLGVNHQKYSPLIRSVGALISFAVPIAFASMPIYFLLKTLIS